MNILANMKNWTILPLAYMIVWILMILPTYAISQAIEISPDYPQYWSYQGEPVLLLGGSVEDKLFQIPNLEEHLDLLSSVGGNYLRNTMSSRNPGDLWPFYFDEESKLYDLDKWNEAYWQRFENFLKQTAKRNIIVQIEFWATFDYYRDTWERNPFNPKNNISYDAARVDLPEEIPTHPIFTDNPFFWSIPKQNNNMRLLWYQQRFVDKLLSYSLNYGNVLYCIDNETSVTALWGQFWSEYIKKKALEVGRKVFVTEMWDPWDLDHVSHRETFDHPETYDFVEISQNNHQKGQQHWDNGLKQIDRLNNMGYLRPVTNVKTYGNDGGRHGGGTQNGMESFIRSVLFGSAAVRFHRPDSGLGLGKEAQAVIGSMRQLSDQMDFFEAQPRADLLSENQENEAYCRADAGNCYAVYFPAGGSVALDLSDCRQSGVIQWLNVMETTWSNSSVIEPGDKVIIEAPRVGQFVALIEFD